MIKEAYCSYEVSKLLKEKGFDACVYTCYSVEEYPQFMTMVDYVVQDEIYERFGKDCCLIQAPTHQMAMAWLREVHNIHCTIDIGYCGKAVYFSNIFSTKKSGALYNETGYYNSYEEAVETALKYTLENLI